MDAKHYLSILKRRKWVILVTAIIALVITVAGTLLARPEYMATTTIRIITAASGSLDNPIPNTIYSDRLMNTYTKIATSDAVLNELAQKLGIAKPPDVEVEVPANTELLKINVWDTNPTMAQRGANELATILINQIKELYTSGGKTELQIRSERLAAIQTELDLAQKEYESLSKTLPKGSEQLTNAKTALDQKEQAYSTAINDYEQARLSEAVRANAASIIQPAIVPTEADKPNKKINLALGLFLGILGGLGLAFLFENLDTTLYSTRQIEEVTHLPILGRIPAAKGRENITFFKTNSLQEEALRRLRTNLITLDHIAPLKTLLITSAEPNEGKSTILANLARILAQSGRNVLVVDADLRLPTIHKLFNMPNDAGLSNVLKHEARINEVVKHSPVPGVFVLTSGPTPPNPSELLGSSLMANLIKQMAQSFDMVLIDTPAMLAVTDAGVLAQAVDGVVLVVSRAQAAQEAVRAARQQLDDVKAPTVGVVVNRAEEDSAHRYYLQTSTM